MDQTGGNLFDEVADKYSRFEVEEKHVLSKSHDPKFSLYLHYVHYAFDDVEKYRLNGLAPSQLILILFIYSQI